MDESLKIIYTLDKKEIQMIKEGLMKRLFGKMTSKKMLLEDKNMDNRIKKLFQAVNDNSELWNSYKKFF